MNRIERVLLAITVVACARTSIGAEIKTAQVETALGEALTNSKAESELVPGSVRFPSVPLRESNAQVKAERLSVMGDGRLEARMRCQPRRACLPFHATAEVRGNTAAPRSWSESQGAAPSRREKKLKPGTMVTFVRERDGVRTCMRAMALDAGGIGDVVRVRAIDGRHEILRGRLSAGNVVRGES